MVNRNFTRRPLYNRLEADFAKVFEATKGGVGLGVILMFMRMAYAIGVETKVRNKPKPKRVKRDDGRVFPDAKSAARVRGVGKGGDTESFEGRK